MKCLCVCSGGNVRSVTLAFVLKHKGYDAISSIARFNSKKTFDLLGKWADVIYVVQEKYSKAIPDKWKNKIKLFDLGPDIWHHSLNKQLIKKILKIMKKLNIREIDK